MTRSLSSFVALSACLWGCLEDDPNYVPPDSAEAGESGTSTADGTGTGTGTTDTGTTDTGTTDTGTTDTGTSGPMCTPPEEPCADVCVDTSTDKQHCGMCFNKCNPAQEQCVDGMCVPK